eukprot:608254-Alexandrium_andersonii.AAC.1
MPVDRPVLLWLVGCAGELLTKRAAGHDGRAPRERSGGKPNPDDGTSSASRFTIGSVPQMPKEASARDGGAAFG